MWNFIFLVYAAALISSLAMSMNRDKFYLTLPGLCWFAFMATPCFMQAQYFNLIYVDVQRTSVLIIGFALIAGDMLALRHKKCGSFSDQPLEFTLGEDRLMIFCAAGLAVTQFSHLAVMPRIPLLAKLSGAYTPEQLSMFREEASKLLQIPVIIKYIWQTSLIMAPPVVFVLGKARHKSFAVGLLALSCFYSYSLLAKGPALALFGSCSLLVFACQRGKFWKSIRKLACALAIIGISLATVFFASNEIEFEHTLREDVFQNEQLGELSFTWGDHARTFGTLPGNALPFKTPGFLDKLLYRAFVVPAEVSHRWYVYYPDINGKYLEWYGLTPASRRSPSYQPPANTVGNWAYVSRFPESYGSTIGAYCSADADAHARFGLPGVMAAAALLLFLRLAISQFSIGTSTSRVIEITALWTMAIVLPSASVQALISAHGLIVMLLISNASLVLGWITKTSLRSN